MLEPIDRKGEQTPPPQEHPLPEEGVARVRRLRFDESGREREEQVLSVSICPIKPVAEELVMQYFHQFVEKVEAVENLLDPLTRNSNYDQICDSAQEIEVALREAYKALIDLETLDLEFQRTEKRKAVERDKLCLQWAHLNARLLFTLFCWTRRPELAKQIKSWEAEVEHIKKYYQEFDYIYVDLGIEDQVRGTINFLDQYWKLQS